MSRGYVESYYDEDPYQPNFRQPQEIYSHRPHCQTRQPHDPYRNNEAWVTRVDKHDPRMQTGIRYYPETDTFVFPPKRGRGGSYVPAREYSGREFLRMYPNGNAGRIRRRRLDELRRTGRIRARATDRFGEPWPADRQRPLRRRGGGGKDRRRESRKGSVDYEVEFPDRPEEEEEEEEEIELGRLLLTEEPHWDESNE